MADAKTGSVRPARAAKPRILLVDWRQGRGDILQRILAPLARVEVTTARDPRPPRPPPQLILVDTKGRLTLARAARLLECGAPVVVLGATAVPPDPGLYLLAGPLLPSRLLNLLDELLEADAPAPTVPDGPSSPTEAGSWHDAVCACLPLTRDERLLISRATRAMLPVTLVGEPGTGKSLLARCLLTVPGRRFVARHGETPLGEVAADLARGDTLYVAPSERLSGADQSTLLTLLDREPELQLRIVAGTWEPPTRLRDDLRLRIDAVRLTLGPVRQHPEQVANRFGALVRRLASHHGLAAPTDLAPLRDQLRTEPWPLNHEEVTSLAERVLFRASGRPARLADLEGLLELRDDASAHTVEPSLEVNAEVTDDAGQRFEADPAPLLPTTTILGAGDPQAFDSLIEQLAHELRNPLVSIKTFTELLPERYEDEEFRGDYYRIVKDEIGRIDDAVRELTEFADLRAPRPEYVDVGAIVRRLIANHAPFFRKLEAEVVTELQESIRVETDSAAFSYALECALRATIDATVHGKPVQIALRAANGGRGARLTVSYQSSEEFDPAAHRRAPRSLGLRQTLAAHVLRQLGGRLQVERGQGASTIVTITLDGHD